MFPSHDLQTVLLIEEPPVSRSGGSEGSNYVRTVTYVSVRTRVVVIIICRGDETLVVVIPI